MFTSTSPRELFLPMVILFWRTIYSNSRPSRRAIAVPSLSGLHWSFEGLAGADFRAKRAHASLASGREWSDITREIWLPENGQGYYGCLPIIQNVGGHNHVTVALRVLSPLLRDTNFKACDQHKTVTWRNVLRSTAWRTLNTALIVMCEKNINHFILQAAI